MFVKVYASGTNVQRLARCSDHINGVIYTAYSQLETTEPGIIRRRFYCTHVADLKREVELLDEKVMPSWTKIWDKPLGNSAFVTKLLESLTGEDTLRPELNLSNMAGEPIDCFMLLVSADKAPMKHIADIAARALPQWHVKVLNGDYTTNKDAEGETHRDINEARRAGKKGVIIVANQMGSRSYSISEIQATVIAYDRGSVDATVQKVSRCLTPGKTYHGSDKTHGVIVDLSFDPNRAENIQRLILEEAIQVQRSDASDFTAAVRFVLSSVDLFKLNEYGCVEEVQEEDMFRILGDNDNLLKVADVAVDIRAALDSGVFDILANVNTPVRGPASKRPVVGQGAINSIKKGSATGGREPTNSEKRNLEKIINEAIRALNFSATSVYFLAGGGDGYRKCLELIAAESSRDGEFLELFGISASDAITLLEHRALNEAILDVVVQNSRQVDNVFL
jgi:hypothetical protein